MTNYGRVRGNDKPQEIQITDSSVFIASAIQPYEETIEGHYVSGFEYDLVQYSKNEYLLMLAKQNDELKDELQAAKILLGVE